MGSKVRRLLNLACSLAAGSVLVLALGAPTGAASGGGGGGAIPVLVKSKVALTPDIVQEISRHASRVSYVWPEIDAIALTVTPARMADLVADPIVEFVEPDLQVQGVPDASQAPEGVPDPPPGLVSSLTSSSPLQTWNLDMVDTAVSGFDGTGVTVAVVDSGLPQNWADFLPPDSVDTTHAVGFGSEGVGSYLHPPGFFTYIPGVGGHLGLLPHGLAVSSIIVGFPSEVGPIGGSAPGAKILPIRVLNQFNFGYYSWLTGGILYVGRLKEDGVLQGPVVLNYSIQGPGSWIEMLAIDYATAQGVIFVTIAGNFGPAPGSISFPGTLPRAITVGAAGWVREGAATNWLFGDVLEDTPSEVYVAGFSGREPSTVPPASLIDVVAPGSFVVGEWLFGPGFSEGREVGFDSVSNIIFGTSFAAPHVSGITARMLQKNPNLDQAQVEAILRGTALAIPADADGVETAYQFGPFKVPAWGANATGAGLARGAAAVAATPAP